jgi:hypothetical protein
MSECELCGKEKSFFGSFVLDDGKRVCCTCYDKEINKEEKGGIKMKFCSECGKKLSKPVKFCSECGANLSGKKEEQSKDDSIWKCDYCDREFDSETVCLKHEKICSKKDKEDKSYSLSTPKRSWAWLWIILIIIAIILIVVSSNGGFTTSTKENRGFLSTQHETTKCGVFGCNTQTKSCPFWDRNC